MTNNGDEKQLLIRRSKCTGRAASCIDRAIRRFLETEGGREGERETEGGRKGEREGGREREREGGRERGREKMNTQSYIRNSQ